MKTFRKFLQFIEQVLVYAYIWQIPFSWRIIIDQSRGMFDVGFNEYMDISIYIGEVLIIIALLIHIQNNTNNEKSIILYIKNIMSRLFHVERSMVIFSFVVLICINIYWSIDFKLSLVSFVHYSVIFFAVFLIHNHYASRGTVVLGELFNIFSLSVFTQFVIELYQVTHGYSIGLLPLNESILSLDMLNVAKSNVFENITLRGYGTFPHPNVLSAYAIFVIVFMYSFGRNLFHVKHVLWNCIIVMICLSIILTQSKLLIIFLFFMLMHTLQNRFHLFHVKHVKFIVLCCILLIISYISYNDVSISVTTRLSQAIIQVGQFTPSLFGSGIGTYRLSYDSLSLNQWEYEPIHFIPYIALSEIGIVSILLILYSIWIYIRNIPRETWSKMKLPVILFIYVASIDHYLWDIYQGSFIGAMLLWVTYQVTIDTGIRTCHNNRQIK